MKTELPVATVADEVLGLIPTSRGEIFAILTKPTTEPKGAAVILLNGGANTPSMGRNRMSVDIARNLSRNGFHSVRFDYHGVGESTGLVEQLRLDAPFVEDLEAVAAWARSQGPKQIFLAGCCFGSRTSIASAQRIQGLAGMVLFGTPIRDFGKGARSKRMTKTALDWSMWEFIKRGFRVRTITGLFDPVRRVRYRRLLSAKFGFMARQAKAGVRRQGDARNFWVSESLLDSLEYIVQEQIPCVLVYDATDHLYAEVERALTGRLGALMKDPRSQIKIETVTGIPVGKGRLIAEDTLLRVVTDLVESWHGPPASA